VQRRAGVSQEAEAVGRIVSPSITAAMARALGTQRMAVAASLDANERPWASLLTGPAGFIQVVDKVLLRLAVQPDELDPLGANLRRRPELGLLVIDPRTRQRLRLNGRGMLADDGIFLRADAVYGNCPKYIQTRRIVADSEPRAASAERMSALDARQRSWIASADTFFIASFDADGGADASHRGGPPGFVRVLDARRLAFDDRPGNNLFNTLGNLVRNPRAGLLFVDFGSGDVLQLTGRTELRFGPKRTVVFEMEEGVARARASALRWERVERNEQEER
jgi:predicted pyridoxine 5'-phosphate oxidase superfamily flavin-nucleotide-binding protein